MRGVDLSHGHFCGRSSGRAGGPPSRPLAVPVYRGRWAPTTLEVHYDSVCAWQAYRYIQRPAPGVPATETAVEDGCRLVACPTDDAVAGAAATRRASWDPELV